MASARPWVTRAASLPLDSNEAPLELLLSAISSAAYRPCDDLAICVDPAASEFFKDGRYELAGEGRSLSSRLSSLSRVRRTPVFGFTMLRLEAMKLALDRASWR